MSSEESSREVLAALGERGLDEAEAYVKSGRSRRYELGPQGRISSFSSERGWAVRAGNRQASFFVSATGLPHPDGPWPEPEGPPVRLPVPVPVQPWRAPAEQGAALSSEGEAIALLEGTERSLSGIEAGARLLHAVLEDGASEHGLVNSHGIAVTWRSRASSLYLEAAGPGSRASTVSLFLAERESRNFSPAKLARRLANLLWLRRDGVAPRRDRGEILLAPAVAIRILHGLLPLLVGPRAVELARAYRDRRGRLAPDSLTVVDDGRLPGGVLEAPVDGEGSPTRRIALVERGRWRSPLQSWSETSTGVGEVAGCVRRPSWRDLPRVGPSHLFIQPDPKVPARSLLGSVARGYYLAEVEGAGRFDLEGDRFSLPVCGFALRQGRASAPVSGACLSGGIRALLGGIQAVAGDLAFEPVSGMLGAPSILLTGLELGPAAGALDTESVRRSG